MLTLTIPKTEKRTKVAWMLLAGYVVFSAVYLFDYFIPELELFLGLALVPYLLLPKRGDYSNRYLFPALLFLGLAIFVPVKTLIFLTLAFGLLFLIESTIGRLRYYLPVLLLILSPVFRYFSNMLGFPVRLWLSKAAGEMLSLTGKKVSVSGNLISLNGAEFSVDPACAGLQMLAVSLLLALFVPAFYQRRTGRELNLKKLAAILAITILLNLGANLFRIVLLVLFKIPPENLFHDLVGLACLALYVVVPLLLLARYFAGKAPEPEKTAMAVFPVSAKMLTLNFLLLFATVFAGRKTLNEKAAIANAGNDLQLPGYKKELLNEGITKFENPEALIYVKPVRFYSAEHNPTICWTGSGYVFTRMEKQLLHGREIYTGVLQKGNDKLYTAWWFDQGIFKTISHWEWRWQAAKTNSGFNLVNVSAADKETLHRKAGALLDRPLF